MRIIFMGTPDFAVNTLEELIRAGHEVALAVTQPDKPKGRGNAMQFPPVKECALKHEIPVFQPQKIRDRESVDFLAKYRPDIIVVAAFGQILTKEILDMPPFGCVNVHASLLPRYRGSSPIQWAVINGEEVSGVTIQRMDVGIDTGDIIASREVPLTAEETAGSLFEKLAEVGAQLCAETLEQIQGGKAVYTPQDHQLATHTSMIRKELGNLEWSRPAIALERLVRGLNPWPSAYTSLDGKVLKIWGAKVLRSEEISGTALLTDCEPGEVAGITKNAILVQTGEGILALTEVQLQGKKRMPCGDFLRGYPLKAGECFRQL